MNQPQTITWDEVELTEVRPGVEGATVHTPQLTAILYRYRPGSAWEEHAHPQDQITSVISGSIEFVVAGTPVRLRPGQTATIPGGTPHSARVPDTGATTLNVLTRRDRTPDA